MINGPKMHRGRRWFSWAMLYNNIWITAIGAMFIALLAGGIMTTSTMNQMKSGMDNMNGQMNQGSEAAAKFIGDLKGHFPVDQPVVTTRKMLGIINDAKKISARASYLLNNVQPEAIGSTIAHVNTLMGAFTPADVVSAKEHVLNLVAKIDTMVSAIPPEKITQLLTTIGSIDSAKLNTFIDHLNKIGEIKIQL